MEELEWTIKQNKRAIEAKSAQIAKLTASLQNVVESDDWHGYNATSWTDGESARLHAEMSSLIARQRALVDALHMIKKAINKA